MYADGITFPHRPGWLDPTATSDRPPARLNQFTDPAVTANYTLQWVLGAKRVHNLTIDYVGQWNENNAPPAYASALREVMASDVSITQPLRFLVNSRTLMKSRGFRGGIRGTPPVSSRSGSKLPHLC